MKKIIIVLFSIYSFQLSAQHFDWIQTFGDIKSDFASYAVPDPSGGVYIAGHAIGTCDFGGNTLVENSNFDYLARYAPDGTSLWAKKITTIDIESAFDMRSNDLGDVITTGVDANYNYYLLRYDSNGNNRFTYQIPVSAGYRAHFESLCFHGSDEYYGVGQYGGFSPTIPLIAKFKRHQNTDSLLWDVEMFPTDQNTSILSDAIPTADNGVMVFGQFYSSFTVRDRFGDSVVLTASQGILGTDRIWLKYDSNGHIESVKQFPDQRLFKHYQFDSATNAYYAYTEDNNFNETMVRFDTAGHQIWTKYIMTGSPLFWSPKVRIHDGYIHFVASGIDLNPSFTQTTLGFFVLKRFDMDGNVMDSLLSPATPYVSTSKVILGDIAFADQSTYLVGGFDGDVSWGNMTLHNPDSTDNIFVAKIDYDSLFQKDVVNGIGGVSDAVFAVYPNPAKDRLTIQAPKSKAIKAVMLDMVGNSIIEKSMYNGTVGIDIENVASGIYLLQLRTEYMMYVKRITIAH